MTEAEDILQSMKEALEIDDEKMLLMRVIYDNIVAKDANANYSVYVQVNADNYVTAVDSDAFIQDFTFWLKVDEGKGELYKYAKVNYCPKGIQTDGGYNYKLVGGVVVYSPHIEQPTDHNEMASKEDFMVASRRYEVGELVSVQNRMFEVIAVILPESKIVVGNNVQEITLEQYINKKVEEALNK